MIRPFLILLAAIGFVAAPKAQAQSLYEAAYAAWRSGDFPVAYEKLLAFRREPNGRRSTVDFMLGTSACRINTRRNWGYNVLDWMLYAYPLTRDSRIKVARERDICRRALQVANVDTPIEDIVEERAAGMTGFGKTFYWASREKQPVASYPIRRLRPMSLKELTARRVPIGDQQAALALARKLVPTGKAAIHDRFLIISTARHSDRGLQSVGQTLTRYLRFLEAVYDIHPPAHYIAVYLVRDHFAVHELAASLHGLDVSKATVGYAFVDDSSVVGAVPTTAPGTILHELFHLLVRKEFGDIPQWLDEGTASLYEVAGRQGDRYMGLPNWRGRVLRNLWGDRPTVRGLIQTEWFLFDDPAQAKQINDPDAPLEMYFDVREGRRQAAMMAMARYFLLYLERRGELVPVYRAIRDQKFGNTKSNARDRAVTLVEQALGRSADELDREFVAWFRSDESKHVGITWHVVTAGGATYIANANVNIRTGPGIDFERLTTLSKGNPAAIFGETDGWLELRLSDGTAGYVSNRYMDRADVQRWTPPNPN